MQDFGNKEDVSQTRTTSSSIKCSTESNAVSVNGNATRDDIGSQSRQLLCSDQTHKYLTQLTKRIRKNCSAHVTSDGRVYYQNHETKTSAWLPPIDSWNSFDDCSLPYGWEIAIDKEDKTYFINHLNKTTTYEDPRKDMDDELPPIPRNIELVRDPQFGFGFVAGSEKPVIVRFVKEGGPSEHKLQAGDQILKINGEDVMRSPREHVIELVKSCKHSVMLTVCQPHSNNATRKSALLTSAKKARLKNNPSRVRFAEGVVINGSPLFGSANFESCVPFIPNVLKVFLENGQTKTFKYDSSTTVQDVMNSLLEKLSIKCGEHFSLVCEHIKAMRRNKLTLLDPADTLSKIAARPGAHNLRCLFRIMFVPTDAYQLLQKDANSFEYLYQQCCNDVVNERFSPQLKYEVALRLSALQLQQHAISNNCMLSASGKVNLKAIERECGFESFVPFSLLETMKRKELHKLLNHFLKSNQQLCTSGQKSLTSIQIKLHYLKIISELPSYGAKMFSTNIKDSTIESGILVSPKYGISHINSMRNSLPITLAKIEDISSIKVTKDDELCYCIEVQLKSANNKSIHPIESPLHFILEDREAEEFVLILRGYHKLLNKYGTNSFSDKDLPVYWDISQNWWNDSVKPKVLLGLAPIYCGLHTVQESAWSYAPNNNIEGLRQIDLAVPPPRYLPCDTHSRSDELYSFKNTINHENDDQNASEKAMVETIDMPSLVSMEILESQVCDESIKSEDVFKRVNEMNKIIADAENYLADEKQEPLDKEDNVWDENEKLRPADSLLLLTHINGNADNNANGNINLRDAINGELSPTESDSDSFISPVESPLHGLNNISAPDSKQLSNVPRTARSGSSFGLHSPDIYPNLLQAEQELIESLKQLNSDGKLNLKFTGDSIYLDSDLIDLTVIPPPDTPDDDAIGPTIIVTAEDPPTPYKEDIDFSRFSNYDSARVVAELDSLCDTLSEMQSSGANNDNLNFTPTDIDNFIASMTVPPPPALTHNEKDHDTECLSSFIIPPPPSASPTIAQAQDDVIARFWKATDDIKKICNNYDISPQLIKREVHSSSSGESGYDSALNFSNYPSSNNEWPVFSEGSIPKLPLSTVIEVVSSEFDHFNKKAMKTDKKRERISSTESNSCEDLHILKEFNDHYNDTKNEKSKPSPILLRSNSWNSLPSKNNGIAPPTIPKYSKPPIPPCSPSIQEKRRQLASRANGVSDGMSSKHQMMRNDNLLNLHHQQQQQQQNGNHTLVQNINNSHDINDCLIDLDLHNESDELFIQSQRDIDILLARLEEVHENRLRCSPSYACIDTDKFIAAKESLVNQSRHFVTSSKLFVKCATESSPQLIEYLIECVTLLERMYSISEILLIYMTSQAQITCLVDRLKEVAATYAYTVDTVHKLSDTVCSPSTSPYMGLLMTHATSLATALSALMRTLRALNV